MLFLFWDIDGTLLSTGRAGVFAWEDAAAEVLGRPVDFTALQTAGLTDIEIGAMILREHGAAPSPRAVARIVGLYERYLPRSLPRRQGQVMPNVREILAHIAGMRRVFSALLSGNTRAGAEAKLGHYGLAGFFDFDRGAFADGTVDRPSIARKALQIARAAGHAPAADAMYVIGDTPHDIHCANAIGARAIAVATGAFSREELARHDPWCTLAALPDAARFLGSIGRGEKPGAPAG